MGKIIKFLQLIFSLYLADYNVKCTQINNAVLALLNDIQPTTNSNKVTEKNSDSGKTVIQKAEKIYNIDHIDSANFS